MRHIALMAANQLLIAPKCSVNQRNVHTEIVKPIPDGGGVVCLEGGLPGVVVRQKQQRGRRSSDHHGMHVRQLSPMRDRNGLQPDTFAQFHRPIEGLG